MAVAQLVARINSGIVQVKGICYEFIDGFVSRNAIVGIVQEIFANIRSPKITKMYDTTLNAIPNLRKNEIRAISPVNVDRLPSCSIVSKCVYLAISKIDLKSDVFISLKIASTTKFKNTVCVRAMKRWVFLLF